MYTCICKCIPFSFSLHSKKKWQGLSLPLLGRIRDLYMADHFLNKSSSVQRLDYLYKAPLARFSLNLVIISAESRPFYKSSGLAYVSCSTAIRPHEWTRK